MRFSVLFVVAAVGGGVLPPAHANDAVRVVYVSPKQDLQGVMAPQAGIRDLLIEARGEEEGQKVWELMAGQMVQQSYQVNIENSDTEEAVVSVELALEFFDDSGASLGTTAETHSVRIEPATTGVTIVKCADDPCSRSTTLTATVTKATYQWDFLDESEVVISIGGKRRFVEDLWDAEGRLVVRSYSKSYYTAEGFDDRVFPRGEIKADPERFYRLARDSVPGGFATSEAYEMNYYDTNLLPGFKVVEGERKKATLMDSTEISNLDIRGTMAVGDFVQIRELSHGAKHVDVVVGPVCQGENDYRWLRARIRFTLGRAVMKGPDHDAVDRAVRAWLEPVSIGEVALRCGPTSGALVKAWDRETTDVEVEEAMGAPDAEAETGGGRVLVYGELKLTFFDGKLTGFERRGAS